MRRKPFHPRLHGGTDRLAKSMIPDILSSPPTRGNHAGCSRPLPEPLSSPPTRGNQYGRMFPAPVWPFIPAYTGEPPTRTARASRSTFHPRLHGGTAVVPIRCFPRYLSSPPTRGNQGPPKKYYLAQPFIPAYTGEPRTRMSSSSSTAFHPRLHGGTILGHGWNHLLHLSSPPTRGNLVFEELALEAFPFIPAYTGEPRWEQAVERWLTFHPRLHGGTAWLDSRRPGIILSSPPTRGNQCYPPPP